MPQFKGRIDWDQGWGSASLLGAAGKVKQTNPKGLLRATDSANADKIVWLSAPA